MKSLKPNAGVGVRGEDRADLVGGGGARGRALERRRVAHLLRYRALVLPCTKLPCINAGKFTTQQDIY